MLDNELRTKLTDIVDSLCGETALQTADRLKSLHNRILADHARTLLRESFPQYSTAVFARQWDEDTPHLVHLIGKGDVGQLDYDDDQQRAQLSDDQREALLTAERCIVYLGTDEEISDLLPSDNVHSDYVEFDLDLDQELPEG